MLRGLFADKPVYRKFLILVGLVLFCSVIFFMVGALLTKQFFGVDMISDPNALGNLNDPMVIQAMKFLQLFTTGIGMFLVPAIVAAFLFSVQPLQYLNLHRSPHFNLIILSILIMFAAVPAINMMLYFNQQMELPSFLSKLEEWIKESEENATKITEVFLKMNSPGEMIYNLFIVALLPALGEELLFRGLIQKLFRQLTNNIHIAIFLTAILFSAIHMQFYGFLPRMMLGVLFGYMLYWTGNLWVPVIAHLVNNGAAVIFAYIASKQKMPFNQDTIGTGEGEILIALISLLAVCGLVMLLKKQAAMNTDTVSS
jgi:uncharacterized protein